MVDVDRDGPPLVQLKLGVVRQHLGGRGARVLHLDATVGDERRGVEGERPVVVEIVATMLPDDDSGCAVRLGGCDGRGQSGEGDKGTKRRGDEPLLLNRYWASSK